MGAAGFVRAPCREAATLHQAAAERRTSPVFLATQQNGVEEAQAKGDGAQRRALGLGGGAQEELGREGGPGAAHVGLDVGGRLVADADGGLQAKDRAR